MRRAPSFTPHRPPVIGQHQGVRVVPGARRTVHVDVPETADATFGGTSVHVAPRRVFVLRRRDWCVTFWRDEFPWENIDKLVGVVKYVITQREITETGRPHWQTYIEFVNPQSPDFVKNTVFLDNTTHVELRRQTREQARNYCMKEKSRIAGDPDLVGPHEWGEFTQQGQRNDIAVVKEKIAQGATMGLLLEEHAQTVVRYPSGVKLLKQEHNTRQGNTERSKYVRVFWGGSGTGKTRLAMDEANRIVKGVRENIFILDAGCSGRSNDGQLWFDGIEMGNNKVIIIDDYASWMSLAFLLRLLDRYPVRLALKGSTTWGTHRYVFITSNFPPSEWTDLGRDIDKRQKGALMRRLHQIIEFKDDGGRIIHKDVPMPADIVSDDEGEE